MEVQEIKTAAELNQTPPPFVASQSGAVNPPTADEEANLRALFAQADSQGLDALNETVTIPNPMAQPPVGQPPVPAPAPVQSQQTTPIPVPDKFKRPDGTVDEEKLKASSEQLNGAIQEKQKTVEELLADYKAREKELHQVSQQVPELKRQIASLPQTVPQPIELNPNALHQQIMQDYQRDPIGTSVMLTEAMISKKLEPLVEKFRMDEEVRKDSSMRESLGRLASQDPRILNPQYYQAVQNVFAEEPGILGLKNPHEVAWNVVKGRMRLGELSQAPAQPSTPSPILGRGTPPSVSSFSGPSTPQSLSNQAQSVHPYSEEGKAFERQLREATNGLWK